MPGQVVGDRVHVDEAQVDQPVEGSAIDQVGAKGFLQAGGMLTRRGPARCLRLVGGKIGHGHRHTVRRQIARDRFLAAAEAEAANPRPEQVVLVQRLEQIGQFPQLAMEHDRRVQLRRTKWATQSLSMSAWVDALHDRPTWRATVSVRGGSAAASCRANS